MKYKVTLKGTTYEVEVEELDAAQSAAPIRQAAPAAAPSSPAPKAATKAAAPKAAGAGDPVKAPMPGNILQVNVKVGDAVFFSVMFKLFELFKNVFNGFGNRTEALFLFL